MTAEGSAASIGAAVRSGRISAEAVVAAALSRLSARRALNAVVHDLSQRALDIAGDLDRRVRMGESVGPLAGVPLAVKDNICTREIPTTCGSHSLSGYVSPIQATAVERLCAAGAIVVAKTNCDEFAMGSSSETSCYGPVQNPFDSQRVPGGSSGGSAAVVADRQVPLALGSDTGGSVRQPAALCGVFGLKPTYGRVSRWGLVAFGSSFDQIGTFSTSVDDAALALHTIAGADGRDDTCAEQPVPAYRETIRSGVRGFRVGVWRRALQADDIDPRVVTAVEAAAGSLAQDGAELQAVDLPLADEALSIYYVLAAAEASSNLARFDGLRYGRRVLTPALADTYAASRGSGFGTEVKRRIVLGTYVLSAGYHERYYARAQTARAILGAALDRLLQSCDLLLLPTAPAPAFRLGEKLGQPLQMYRCDVFTVPASLSGHPALSIPAPRDRGELPVGVQLIARRFDEQALFQAATALESRGFCCEPPA